MLGDQSSFKIGHTRPRSGGCALKKDLPDHGTTHVTRGCEHMAFFTENNPKGSTIRNHIQMVGLEVQAPKGH